MKIPVTVLVASLAVLLLSGPAASAADKDILQLQLDVSRLQKTINELQSSVDDKNAKVLAQVGKMADQVNNLTASMQKISDLVASTKADSAATNATLVSNAAKSATETRDALLPVLTEIRKSIDELKDGQNSIRTSTKSLSDQFMTMKSTAEPLPTCKDLKQVADRSSNSGYWDDAVSGYRDFLSNPMCSSDPKAGEVQFQIAESYFNWKKFDQAVQEYDIFLQKFPPNDKTASALLRKGLAYAELKKTTEARAALTRVTTEFKGTPEAATAAEKLKELAPAAAGRGAR